MMTKTIPVLLVEPTTVGFNGNHVAASDRLERIVARLADCQGLSDPVLVTSPGDRARVLRVAEEMNISNARVIVVPEQAGAWSSLVLAAALSEDCRDRLLLLNEEAFERDTEALFRVLPDAADLADRSKMIVQFGAGVMLRSRPPVFLTCGTPLFSKGAFLMSHVFDADSLSEVGTYVPAARGYWATEMCLARCDVLLSETCLHAPKLAHMARVALPRNHLADNVIEADARTVRTWATRKDQNSVLRLSNRATLVPVGRSVATTSGDFRRLMHPSVYADHDVEAVAAVA